MKKLISMLVIVLALVGCTGHTPMSQHEHNILIAYFSATGNTEEAAILLQQSTGAEMLEILPAVPYTEADLDWKDSTSRSSLEMKDEFARPTMATNDIDLTNYDVIYLGYPIWWDQAPRIINSFLDSQELKGKTIIPFCTSGSSTIDNSQALLRKTYPDAKWLPGRRLTDMTDTEIEAWVMGDDEEEEE